jgi:hypothetical protein
MGFWHTGYAEFHEFTGLDDIVFVPSPVRYACEQCSQVFDKREELRRHRFEQHPLRQPALFLRGHPTGTLPVQLMTSLQVQDVIVEDTKHCTLNGHTIAPDELGDHLAIMRREYVEIDLSNDGVYTRCLLDFRVAEEEHLVGVEQAFARMVHEHMLNLDAVSRFIKDCKAFSSATDYYNGICHYLYGVMAKEHASDSGLNPDQYAERYLRAGEALAGFERSLACSICALVAFHFNHFLDAEKLASEGTLRHTASAFAGLLEGRHFGEAYSLSNGSAVEDLLIDQDTLQIVDDASRGLSYLKSHADDLLAAVRRMGSSYDRLKRQLLAGEAFAARNDDVARVEVRRLARELVGQNATEAWATALLERTRKS